MPRIQAIELEYEVFSTVKTAQAYKLTTNKKVCHNSLITNMDIKGHKFPKTTLHALCCFSEATSILVTVLLFPGAIIDTVGCLEQGTCLFMKKEQRT